MKPLVLQIKYEQLTSERIEGLCPDCWTPSLWVFYGYLEIGPMTGMRRMVLCEECRCEIRL